MKSKLILWFAITALLAGSAGWFAGRRLPATNTATSNHGARRIEFYQDSMHPWIKSDNPGKCTICGMDLTPVHEGEQSMDGDEGLVTLSANNINVANIRTAPAKRHHLRKTLRLAGTISAADERRVFVSARVDGQVEKLYHENLLGHVKEGTPLAIQSSKTVTELQREYISYSLSDAAAKLGGGEQERLRLLGAARARLVQLGFSGTQVDALPSRTELDTAMEIQTPIAGTVVARQVYEGMAVKEGQRMFEIVDFSSVWFRFDCYEGDMAWIAPGLEMEIRTPSVPGRTFKAKVTFLEPSIGHMVRSIKGRAELDNPLVLESGQERRLLREREFAEGVICVEAADVLAVPRTAVLSPGTNPLIYIEKAKGIYVPRYVTLGRVGDDFVEVSEGISEGDTIVTRGNLLLDSHAQINQSGAPIEAPGNAEGDALLASVNSEQQFKASEMFGIAASMASALSRDNLDQFNRQVPALESALLPFCHVFAGETALKKVISQFEVVAHIPPAQDLAAARKAFLPFSNALVGFAKMIRHLDTFRYLRIYHCPMVDDAVPGGPKDGYWMQAIEPLRNPFFGASMIGCGVEMKAPVVGKPVENSLSPSPQTAPKSELLPLAPAPPPSSQMERYP